MRVSRTSATQNSGRPARRRWTECLATPVPSANPCAVQCLPAVGRRSNVAFNNSVVHSSPLLRRRLDLSASYNPEANFSRNRSRQIEVVVGVTLLRRAISGSISLSSLHKNFLTSCISSRGKLREAAIVPSLQRSFVVMFKSVSVDPLPVPLVVDAPSIAMKRLSDAGKTSLVQMWLRAIHLIGCETCK